MSREKKVFGWKKGWNEIFVRSWSFPPGSTKLFSLKWRGMLAVETSKSKDLFITHSFKNHIKIIKEKTDFYVDNFASYILYNSCMIINSYKSNFSSPLFFLLTKQIYVYFYIILVFPPIFILSLFSSSIQTDRTHFKLFEYIHKFILLWMCFS